MKGINPWILLPISALFVVFAAGLYFIDAFSIVDTMIDQPSIKLQEKRFLPPILSVPTIGREKVLDFFDTMDLENPVSLTPESIEAGQGFYEIYCLVCHGGDGKGKGPIASKLNTPPVDLSDAYIADLPDGYLYTVIRQGGTMMPPQQEGLSSRERWQVVHYLRFLQGARGGMK